MVHGFAVAFMLLDKFSELAFKFLVTMLPTPPKRGVKNPRLSPEASIKQFFVLFEVSHYIIFTTK